MNANMDKYMYFLAAVEGLGNRARNRLLEAFHTPEQVYLAKEKYLRLILEEKKLALFLRTRREWDVDVRYQRMREQQIYMLSCREENFPRKLREIPDPPFVIFYKGALPEEERLSVAVVGARECSGYGEYIGRELGQALGEAGIQVISGMARGIDGISQAAALEAGGTSYGVLGCGVDICYPRGNQKLYQRLTEQGGILSPYPPGTAPKPNLFPPRNRIVSGLADVLVVVEARQKSGTLITVDMALEQGREVYAVPGRVTDRLSDGCNKLLREGASVFLSPKEFLRELESAYPGKWAACGAGAPRAEENASGTARMPGDTRENALLQLLDPYPQSVDMLSDKLSERFGLRLEHPEILSLLMGLCLKGKAIQNSGSWFSKSL